MNKIITSRKVGVIRTPPLHLKRFGRFDRRGGQPVGGTALSAFYLHHRLSEDLDFFSEKNVEIEEILGFVKLLPLAREAEYERKYDRDTGRC